MSQGGGKEAPNGSTAHIEEELRDAVGGDPGNTAEDDGIDKGGQKRLKEDPRRTEDGLLVDQDEAALGKKADQIAITPDFLKVQIQPPPLGGDNCGKFFVHGDLSLYSQKIRETFRKEFFS